MKTSFCLGISNNIQGLLWWYSMLWNIAKQFFSLATCINCPWHCGALQKVCTNFFPLFSFRRTTHSSKIQDMNWNMLGDKLYQFLRRPPGPLGGLAAMDAGGSSYSGKPQSPQMTSWNHQGSNLLCLEVGVVRIVSLVQPEKDITVNNGNVNKVKKCFPPMHTFSLNIMSALNLIGTVYCSHVLIVHR